MKYIQIKIVILLLFIFSCSSSKKIKANELVISKTEEINKHTTKFYEVLAFCKPNKKVFKLSEQKNCDIDIVNFGTKDLYVPEWLDIAYQEHSELYIEVYKIIDNNFVIYKSRTVSNIHTKPDKRKIISTKNGKFITFKGIELDKFMKINDTGRYYAKIYIDLSDFGYFKIIEGDAFFEVVES